MSNTLMLSGPGRGIHICGHIEPKIAALFTIGIARELSPRTVRRRQERYDKAQARKAAKAVLKKGGAA